MKRFVRSLSKAMKWGTLLSTFLFITLTLIQIYGRFFMEKAPSWTEEAARVAFIYAIAFAAGLAIRGTYYVNFGFLVERLPERFQRNLKLFIYGILVVFCCIFTFYALEFVMMGWIEKSPSIKYRMAISFSGVAIMGISLLLQLVQQRPKAQKP